MNEMIKNWKIFGLIILAIFFGIVFIAGIFLFQLFKPNSIKEKSNNELINETRINSDNVFIHVPKELLKQDSDIYLIPNEGYFITTSILSHKGDKIVYAQMSNCIELLNQEVSEYAQCDWSYQIWIKDLQTNEREKIYSYPQEVSFFNFSELLIPKVYAGGCPLVYFPLAWSKHDQKIILQWANPTSCGSGGVLSYLTYTFDISTKQQEPLARYDAFFFDDYSKVIFVDESVKSLPQCGPVVQKNKGKIVLKNIETNEILILLEEPNSSYSLSFIDSNQMFLRYTADQVIEADGCSQIDSSISQMRGQINLPKLP